MWHDRTGDSHAYSKIKLERNDNPVLGDSLMTHGPIGSKAGARNQLEMSSSKGLIRYARVQRL